MTGNGKETPRVTTAGLTEGKICPGSELRRSRSEKQKTLP
jgi:hypothetical protein